MDTANRLPEAGSQPTGFAIPPGDKAVPVMVYTANTLAWGDVVLRESVRASTWLRTVAVPRFVCLHNAQLLRIHPGSSLRPASYSELHLPTAQVIAFHLKPPAADPLDYDPNEPMRMMFPAVALVGGFHFKGKIRMSTQSDLYRYLDVAREPFLGIYDLTITLPEVQPFGQIHTQFSLVRCECVSFAPE